MIERTPVLNILTHAILIFGLVVILVPIWLAFVAATHTLQAVNASPVEFWPGDQLWPNLQEAWVRSDFGPKFVNSLIVAIGVVVGKITLACITAFALVFFNFRGHADLASGDGGDPDGHAAPHRHRHLDAAGSCAA